MMVFSSDQIHALVSMERLIGRLEEAFKADPAAPSRQILGVPGGAGGRLLLSMPAFNSDGSGVVKLSTVFPDNAARGLPTIQGVIILFSEAGAPRAVFDGAAVTHLRTGATSALASKYLSRTDSEHLVIIGTGSLAPAMAAAHSAIRPINRISVCGRTPQGVTKTVAAIRAWVDPKIAVVAAASIPQAVGTADIACCATSSATPILAGDWLRPGTFVDLVGSFSPERREADDDLILRSRLFVDTREGALTEAGDILVPLRRGVIDRSHIEGELSDLACGRVPGRRDDLEITVFKSVGAAITDLAASQLIFATANAGRDQARAMSLAVDS